MASPARFSLLSHRSHDVAFLFQRWQALAKKLRIPVVPLGEHDGLPIIALASGWEDGGFYVSAGIHGDESGATEGLLLWAERGGLEALQKRKIPFFLAPCLNPWGLSNNQRLDAKGRDLNRCFGPEWSMPNSAVRDAIVGRKFNLALTLHEDFDAQGLYLYEVRGPKPYWGEKLAESVAHFLPADQRTEIESRRAKGGRHPPEARRQDARIPDPGRTRGALAALCRARGAHLHLRDAVGIRTRCTGRGAGHASDDRGGAGVWVGMNGTEVRNSRCHPAGRRPDPRQPRATPWELEFDGVEPCKGVTVTAPFQGSKRYIDGTQGVALGCLGSGLRPAEEPDRKSPKQP